MGADLYGGAQELADNITRVIVNPVIALLFAVGFLVFVWGVIEFMAGLSGVGEGAQKGKNHMLWGLIGMFVMVAAYAILQLIANTLHVQLPA